MNKSKIILRTWHTYLYTHLHKTLRLSLICGALSLIFSGPLMSLENNERINVHNLVILQYHHVSETTPKSTSVSPQVFQEHMALLAKSYHIIDLGEALRKLKNNEKLPNKSVAITFDDGYTNLLKNAHPVLQKYDFPYTVFINPSLIGKLRSQLSWQQIKQMQPLATFANHTLDHAHLLTKLSNESSKQWLTRVMQDIDQAEQLIEKQLGYSKKWLAFPYGEFNTDLKQALLAQDYIGFGQQSGAVSGFSDFGALPRYPAAGDYANIDSLITKLDSLAMPLIDVTPADTEYSPGQTLSELSFKVTSDDVQLATLACYFKGQKLAFEEQENAVVISLNHQFVPGRVRINCTAPSHEFTERYYWFSYPTFTATKEGKFLD